MIVEAKMLILKVMKLGRSIGLSVKEAVRFWVQIPSSADLFSFLYHFSLGDASILKNFRQKVMLQFLAVWALMKNA